MTTTPAVIAAFAESTQAQDAISDLQRAGFGPNQIRYSVHKSGAEITSSLERLGLTQEEASFYNREFEAGRTVVLVAPDGRKSEAYDILRRDGGYDYREEAHVEGKGNTREEAHVEGKGDTNMQGTDENAASEA
jgi:hypothetical protein